MRGAGPLCNPSVTAPLTFRIVVEPQQPIRLEVTGPSGSTAMIKDFFGA
jgi:hypothetical protein